MHIVLGVGASVALLVLVYLFGYSVGKSDAERQIKKLDAWQRREKQRAALRAAAASPFTAIGRLFRRPALENRSDETPSKTPDMDG